LLKYPSRPALIAALSGAAVMLAGCQSYQSRPLDLTTHRDGWLARTPGDEPVRAFAERLAESGEPSIFDLSDGLTLAEGEIVALVFNPDLRLARLRAGIAAATAEHAGLWDDPQFGLDFLSLTENASNPLVVAPGLSFTIPISGRLEAGKARADASLAAELTRVAEQEWQTRVEVRRAWLCWSAARLKAEQTERLLASIDSLVASTAKLAEAGEIMRTEAALFTIEQATRRQALLRFRGDAAEAEHGLRSLLGLAPEAPLELVPTIVIDLATDNLTADAMVQQSLTLARLRDEYEVAEQTLRREVREQYPDLTIGPVAEFDRGDTLLGISLALPIPILNANKQGIAEAHAERDFARAAFETAYERLAGSLAATRVRLANICAQREIIETSIAPMVDRQLADAQNLLQIGEGGTLVLLESLSRVGQTQMGLIDARLDESLVLAELSFLVGPPSAATIAPSNPQSHAEADPAPATHEGDAAREVNP
jgi:cobalt-zinc-cadmium efflux system outer membrane protein